MLGGVPMTWGNLFYEGWVYSRHLYQVAFVWCDVGLPYFFYITIILSYSTHHLTSKYKKKILKSKIIFHLMPKRERKGVLLNEKYHSVEIL